VSTAEEMKFTHREIREADEVRSQLLRERARLRTPRTQQFLWEVDGYEAAFVSMDLWPDYLLLYEIFVLDRHRRRGVGSKLLNWVEDFAIKKGYSTVRLKPKPLDNNITRRDLLAWYQRAGYRFRPDEPNVMEKFVS